MCGRTIENVLLFIANHKPGRRMCFVFLDTYWDKKWRIINYKKKNIVVMYLNKIDRFIKNLKTLLFFVVVWIFRLETRCFVIEVAWGEKIEDYQLLLLTEDPLTKDIGFIPIRKCLHIILVNSWQHLIKEAFGFSKLRRLKLFNALRWGLKWN